MPDAFEQAARFQARHRRIVELEKSKLGNSDDGRKLRSIANTCQLDSANQRILHKIADRLDETRSQRKERNPIGAVSLKKDTKAND